MPHPARHSRPKARLQDDQHALGSLLEEVDSRRAPASAAHRLGEEHAKHREEHAHDATDLHVAVRSLDARTTCCGPTSDVPHEASCTGTALGGALLCDAATRGDSSSHMHAACWLNAEDDKTAAEPHPPPEPRHTTPMEMAITLRSNLLTTSTLDEENLVQLMSELQMSQTIVVQQIQNAISQRRYRHAIPAAAQSLATDLVWQQQAGGGNACRETSWSRRSQI